MRIIDTNYFFSGDFQGQEGVCIMHQCALYNPKYGMWFQIINFLWNGPNIYIYEVRVTHTLYQCRQMGKQNYEFCKDRRQTMP
jgi:hypothetical protein